MCHSHGGRMWRVPWMSYETPRGRNFSAQIFINNSFKWTNNEWTFVCLLADVGFLVTSTGKAPVCLSSLVDTLELFHLSETVSPVCLSTQIKTLHLMKLRQVSNKLQQSQWSRSRNITMMTRRNMSSVQWDTHMWNSQRLPKNHLHISGFHIKQSNEWFSHDCRPLLTLPHITQCDS